MKVSELAEELGVPTSAVIEQCKRTGIDASWAGAELSGSDVVVLRAELAEADAPLDLTPTDPIVPPPPAAEPAGGAALPPTSAASWPDAAEPMPSTPSASAPADASSPPTGLGASTAPPSAGAANAATAATVPPRRDPTRRPTPRRLDKAVRGGVAALIVAVIALGIAEVASNAWVVWSLWLLGAIALFVAFWNGNAGRRHVTTHPERYSGLVLAVLTMVLALGLAIVVGTSVSAAVGDDPAADTVLGDRDSVATARWSFLRIQRVADAGWKTPAKEAGTCWVVDDEEERDDRRIEFGTDQVGCDSTHTVEVVRVFAVDRDPDSRYPGADALQELATERCGDLVAGLLDPEEDGSPIEGLLAGEIPTADGWRDGDHDVACIVVTEPRTKPLS